MKESLIGFMCATETRNEMHRAARMNITSSNMFMLIDRQIIRFIFCKGQKWNRKWNRDDLQFSRPGRIIDRWPVAASLRLAGMGYRKS